MGQESWIKKRKNEGNEGKIKDHNSWAEKGFCTQVRNCNEQAWEGNGHNNVGNGWIVQQVPSFFRVCIKFFAIIGKKSRFEEGKW